MPFSKKSLFIHCVIFSSIFFFFSIPVEGGEEHDGIEYLRTINEYRILVDCAINSNAIL